MLFANVVGIAVGGGLLVWLVRLYAARWRLLAGPYAGKAPDPARARKPFEQVVVVASPLAFQRYVPLAIGIHETGMSLALIPPFSVSCPPLFLPFDEMRCRRTDWFLNASSLAIRLARADVDIIVDESLWSWIESNSPLRLDLFAASASERGQQP